MSSNLKAVATINTKHLLRSLYDPNFRPPKTLIFTKENSYFTKRGHLPYYPLRMSHTFCKLLFFLVNWALFWCWNGCFVRDFRKSPKSELGDCFLRSFLAPVLWGCLRSCFEVDCWAFECLSAGSSSRPLVPRSLLPWGLGPTRPFLIAEGHQGEHPQSCLLPAHPLDPP